MMHHTHRYLVSVALLVAGLLLGACGGGGGGSIAGGGIGGTGVTSGTVSGFGSVFVNGIEFETDGASRTVDGVTDISNGRDDDSKLGIGMVVTIVGKVNKDGVSGTADSIVYDDEIEGPVAADPVPEDADDLRRTFDIFNLTVVVDRDSTVYAGTDYAAIAQDDILEVSGYFDPAGRLLATRVEKTDELVLGTSVVEIKGTVSGFNGVETFSLAGLTVTFDGTTVFEDLPGTVQNGQFVEVKGTLLTATSVAAQRIEREDEGFGDNVDEISIEGLVTDFRGLGSFRVADQRVNASSASFTPPSLETTIANGDKVEVEGSIVNGFLNARDVEQRGGDVRVSALVASKNTSAGTVRLQVVQGESLITVHTNSQTQIEDKRDEEAPFGVQQIDAGDFLNVEGYIDGNGDFIASQIERDELDDIELRGPVDVPPTSGGTSSGTVAILGISIATDAATEFDSASESSISGDVFFLQVSDGDLVGFTDDNQEGALADGIADGVGFED